MRIRTVRLHHEQDDAPKYKINYLGPSGNVFHLKSCIFSEVYFLLLSGRQPDFTFTKYWLTTTAMFLPVLLR